MRPSQGHNTAWSGSSFQLQAAIRRWERLDAEAIHQRPHSPLLARLYRLHQLAKRIETAEKAGAGVNLNQDFLDLVDRQAGVQPLVEHGVESRDVARRGKGSDPTMSPMKAKGVGELGVCGVPAAIASAVYNATGIRVRDYPITLDKYLQLLPAGA